MASSALLRSCARTRICAISASFSFLVGKLFAAALAVPELGLRDICFPKRRHSDAQGLWFDTPRTTCRIDVVVSSIKAACAAPQSLTCRSGGIGRRAWFRSMYPQGCGGSSPFFGTKVLLSGSCQSVIPTLIPQSGKGHHESAVQCHEE